MKRLWLLVFPICLLLSWVVGCRAPFDAEISAKTAPKISIEEGAKIRFVATYAFKITWCTDASCTPPHDLLGPCTKQVQGTEKEKHGTNFVGTCIIRDGASQQHYYYVFDPTAGGKVPAGPYEFPDNIEPCKPPCSKGHNQ
jgi:hypothetical protein